MFAGADEGQVVGADHLGEALVLGQEAVAGVEWHRSPRRSPR
jgi:hypothetical protein